MHTHSVLKNKKFFIYYITVLRLLHYLDISTFFISNTSVGKAFPKYGVPELFPNFPS